MNARAKSVRKLTRTAHHEAAHAVLSAALNDGPHLVSIRKTATSLGRAKYRREASSERLVQVDLAGFAAEEILCGRRSRQLDGPELLFSILWLLDERLSEVPTNFAGCDQYLAVQEILSMGCPRTPQAIRAEFERYYAIAKDSVASVWPSVVMIARALLKAEELDSEAFFGVLGEHDIYGPVFAVQRSRALATVRVQPDQRDDVEPLASLPSGHQ